MTYPESDLNGFPGEDIPEPEPQNRNWFCGNIWKTGCVGDGWTGAKGTVCKPCNEKSFTAYKTQCQVHEEHMAMLESLKYWFDNMKPEAQAHISTCPWCGRDCVVDSFNIGGYPSTWYIDGAQFYGAKWKFTKYCREDGTRVDI